MSEAVKSAPISETTGQTASLTGSTVGSYRWTICALLFFAATINYIDRQVIGILKPTLQTEIGWTEVGYSWVVFSFQTAYAIGFIFVGRLMDSIGTRKGFSLARIQTQHYLTKTHDVPATVCLRFSRQKAHDKA